MLRKTLDMIFSSRVFYIVFSLLASIALWMYVEITENREEEHRVNDIPVVFNNYDVLRDKGFLISEFDPQTVNLSFECTRAIASQLTNRTLSVAVDLAGINSTGNTRLSYTINFPSAVDRAALTPKSRSVERISLSVDRLSSRDVQVRVNYRGGTAADNLIAEQAEFEPHTITVSGPEEVVSRIYQAFVPVTRENLAATFKADLEFILLDDDGDEIDENLLSSVTSSHETINVTIPIKEVKDVPLTVDRIHGAGTSEQNTTVSIDPPMVTVSGDPSALRNFNSITLGTVDMTRFGRTTTVPFPIIVPDHLRNLSGETEAFVLVEVTGLEISYFSTSNLQWINTPPGLSVDMRTQTLDVRIRGTPDDLLLVSRENIRVVADLSDYGTGISVIPARVHVDGVDADVGAVGVEYRVTVRLYREND